MDGIKKVVKLHMNINYNSKRFTIEQDYCKAENELIIKEIQRITNKYLPQKKPDYLNSKLDPYQYLSQIGKNEKEDPLHYGYSLVRKIQNTPGMEIGSHSFCHFYCLEPRLNPNAFREDIEASVASFARLGIEPKSFVFCRNQYNIEHLNELSEYGFRFYRGNPKGYIYESKASKEQTLLIKGSRFIDSYLDISSNNQSEINVDLNGLINIPASRFLRPVSSIDNIFGPLRLQRILKSMESAAINNQGYHLWWHPFNFGTNLRENIKVLSIIIKHFRKLQDKYGMLSVNMSEIELILKNYN